MQNSEHGWKGKGMFMHYLHGLARERNVYELLARAGKGK